LDNPWSTRFRYLMLGVMALGMAGFIWYVRVVFAPLIIGALIAYVLNPVVDWLGRRTHLSRRAMVSIVFLLGLTLLVAVPAILVPILINEIQTLIRDLDQTLAQAESFLSATLIISGQPIRVDQFLPDLTSLITDSVSGITLDALHLIESTTKNLLWLLVTLAAIYSLLRDWDQLREWLIRLAPKDYRDDARRIYEEIKLVWRGYLRGNLALMTVTGILFTIAWLAIGMPGALILGLIAGLLTIIPDLGPAIAALLAVIVAFVEGPIYMPVSNFWFGIIALAVYLILINIKNIFIRPRIFGRSVHMHDGIVFIAIVAAVVIQGVLGALIVIPVLASGAVISRYIWRRIQGEDPFPEPPAPLEPGIEPEGNPESA